MLLSVIIPTLNRGNYVSDLLDSLAKTDPSNFEWEVIVVDNGSIDNTAKIVLQKQQALPIKIRYVLETRPGLHEGRHRGTMEAAGEYLAYLDDDMIVSPTWLQGIRMIEEKEADAVVGRILPKWVESPPDWLKHMCKSGVFGYLGLLDLGDTPRPTDKFFGGNLFTLKSTIIQHGGFHPDGIPEAKILYRGDGETGLWMKMQAAGMRLLYDPAALVYHIIPQERMSKEYLFKRAYNQGISSSFTYIRECHGLYSNKLTGWQGCRAVMKKWASRQLPLIFMRYFSRRLKTLTKTEREILCIQYEMFKCQKRGWISHRTAFHHDPTLRNHVLKQSFLNDDQA
jgi:glucosyl-dolichyl phosphate glucuronosyltransferase